MGQLRCHCDKCPNNTCEAQENYGLCYAEFRFNTDGELKKNTGCFNKDENLMHNLACGDFKTTITRCCKSVDYCNQKEGFMPPIDEIRKKLETQISSNGISSEHTRQEPAHGLTGPLDYLVNQYSRSTIEMRLVFIILSGLLLISVIALAQNFLSRRRRPTRESEDCSENSSGKVNSDVAVYDTNSMASREPLINNSCNVNLGTNPINLVYHTNSLNHPLPIKGPWMADDSCNGKAQSTFQMSVGSGDPANKPETSSGSGSGQPYLTQRSIAHDIELAEVVGRGYFGVVWRGEYKGEPVAVKIFSALAEPSWEREAEIYQTTLLRHKNILGFIATDKRDDVTMTGYWLVTDYYPMGSLYDFLTSNSMSMQDAVRMAFSIANGLAHLHTEIFGTQGKPAIAHRDLKSKNILVKNDGTCCIADLGMAVRYNSHTGVVDVPANSRVGTRRYLAPELLQNRLNLMDFEAVKATDVYALGLVLWEVLRRTCFMHPSAAGVMDPNYQNYNTEKRTVQQPSSPQSQVQPQKVSESIQMDSNQEQQDKTSEEQQESGEEQQQVLLEQKPQTSPSTMQQTQYEAEPLAGKSVQQERSPKLSRQSPPIHDSPRIYQYESMYSYSISNNLNESSESSFDDINNELAIVCDRYEAPYQEFIPNDPTLDEMTEIVCIKKLRPSISLRWTKFAPMRDYTTLMRECWYEKPHARLTALRIRKTLGEIARHYFNLNMEYD